MIPRKKFLILLALGPSLGLGLFLSACDRTGFGLRHELRIGAAQAIDSLPASCPFLTQDDQGHPVLSFVQEIRDSVFIMAYAISLDQGKSFGKTVTIPASLNVQPHGENLPKMVFKPSGEILAVWGIANPSPTKKYGGLALYAQSFDGGKTFSEAKPLVRDTAGIDQRYFDVALLPSGEAAILWLDNRKSTEKEGSALYLATTHGKDGFGDGKAIGETCCQCCRTDLFVDAKGGIHAAYRLIVNDSIRDMVHIVSRDGGETFSAPLRISPDNWVIRGCPHTGPTMAENQQGMQFAWYTQGGGAGVFFSSSKDDGKTFAPRDSISGLASAKHPQLTTSSKGDIVIVWDETVPNGAGMAGRIGLQVREADGKPLYRKSLTMEGEDCEFPVVEVMGGDAFLIAYVKRENKIKRVYFKTLH